MLRNSRYLFCAVALFAAVLMCSNSIFAKPGNGNGGGGGNSGGGGEDPPVVELPPVRYQVQFFDVPYQANYIQIRGTNNSGQAVGRIHQTVGETSTQSAFLYDPQFPAAAIDLNTIVEGIPPGWKLRNATAINESGDIAVYLKLEDAPTLTYQAAMIDMNAVDTDGEPLPPQLLLIPDANLTSEHSLFPDMNDFGDIVAKFKREDGTYGLYVYNFGWEETAAPMDLGLYVSFWPHINNNGQVAGVLSDGTIFRDSLGQEGAFETFLPVLDESTGNITELTRVYDINDAGELSGSALVNYPKKVKGSNGERRCFIQGNSLETFRMDGTEAYMLNESSDFVSGQMEFFHRSYVEGGGVLLASDLLDPTDSDSDIWAESVSTYTLWGINERDLITDFPQLFGEATFVDGSRAGFVLTPVLYP